MLEMEIIPVTSFVQNCTILWDRDSMHGGIIDPGGDIDRIQSFIKTNKIVIDHILLTHGHADHAAAAGTLARHYHVSISGPHEDDLFLIEKLSYWCGMLDIRAYENFTPTFLCEGDEIRIGSNTLEVLHLPGHTPGHVIFYCKERKIAFVGDVLFHLSIGRSDLPGGNFNTLISSITQKLWPLGDDIKFIPGHGPSSTFGHEKHKNPYFSRKQ